MRDLSDDVSGIEGSAEALRPGSTARIASPDSHAAADRAAAAERERARRAAIWVAAGLSVAVLGVWSAGARAAVPTAAPIPKTCPTASVVKAALGGNPKTATVIVTAYARICTYAGSILPTRISFQEDTPATFAISEKAVSTSVAEKIHGLGQAAWATSAGGSLYVFTGKYTIKLLAPLVSLVKLEGLARKLLE